MKLPARLRLANQITPDKSTLVYQEGKVCERIQLSEEASQ